MKNRCGGGLQILVSGTALLLASTITIGNTQPAQAIDPSGANFIDPRDEKSINCNDGFHTGTAILDFEDSTGVVDLTPTSDYPRTAYARIPSTAPDGRSIISVHADSTWGDLNLKPGTYYGAAQAYAFCGPDGNAVTGGTISFDAHPGTYDGSAHVWFDSVEYGPDTIPPVITASNETITLDQAKTWTPMHNVTAKDGVDGDITSKVKSSPATRPTIMTTTPGTYTFTYTVTDSGGNTATATRTITVVRTSKLVYKANNGTTQADRVYTRNEGQTMKLEDGSAFTPPAGKTFTGWNTEPDGSGDTYHVGDTFTFGATDVTLYAQWGITQMPVTGAPMSDMIIPTVTMGVIVLAGGVLLVRRRRTR